jgi:hypothetical protein
MANARIRYAPLYLNNVKLGDVHTNSLNGASGDEAAFDADGYAGHTDGAGTSKVSATAIVPVIASNTATILGLFKNKSYCELGQFINGAWVQATYRCVSYNIDTDRKSGKLEGKFEFEGGEVSVN